MKLSLSENIRSFRKQRKMTQEGVVAADLKDVEAHREAVQDRAKLGYQRAQEDQTEVSVSKNVAFLLKCGGICTYNISSCKSE